MPIQTRRSSSRAPSGISGFHYKKARRSRLWQRYGFEHVLRDDELTLVAAKYILENPIRAGLVERVEDYSVRGIAAMRLRTC